MQPTVLVPQSAPPAHPAAPLGTTRFIYDGQLSELYIIFLKNVLLTIVTLGIYRFWGKTNVRRYLWSRTSLLGDRFEYTGTGKELFLGFLIVMGFLVVIAGTTIGLTFLVDRALRPLVLLILLIVLYPALFYFYFIAQFTALRYRLTRTRWRGIRGAMSGSPWKYGFVAIGWWVLSALSAGLLTPIPVFKTLEFRLKNVYFGTARTNFDGNVSDVFLRYLAYYFGAVFLGAVAIGIVIAVLASFGLYDGLASVLQRVFGQDGRPPDGASVARLNYALVITLYACLPVVGLFVLPLFCWYASFLYNYLLGHTAIAGGRFAGTVTPGRMFGYIVINALIMIFTLGFGFPWVLHRIMQFVSANIEIVGSFDTASIQQNQMPAPKRGEGLLDLIDPGII